MSSCQKNVKYQPNILIVQLQYQMKRLMNHTKHLSYLIFLGNPPIFPTSLFWKTHQFFLPHFLEKPTIFPTSLFFGKPTNFSYLIFWETHQFFLPHLLGNPQFFLPHFFGKPTNFSYLIFLGNPLIWLMKLLKKLHPMRFLASISIIIWNFCKLFTMKEGTIDTYKTTSPLLSYLIRVLRNLSLKI